MGHHGQDEDSLHPRHFHRGVAPTQAGLIAGELSRMVQPWSFSLVGRGHAAPKVGWFSMVFPLELRLKSVNLGGDLNEFAEFSALCLTDSSMKL